MARRFAALDESGAALFVEGIQHRVQGRQPTGGLPGRGVWDGADR